MIYIVFVLVGICAALLLIIGHQSKVIEELEIQIEDFSPLQPITIDADFFDITDDLPELGDDND